MFSVVVHTRMGVQIGRYGTTCEHTLLALWKIHDTCLHSLHRIHWSWYTVRVKVTISYRISLFSSFPTASSLRGNTGLTELRLYYCNIRAEGMSQVAEALCGISTLRDLNLSGNTVDSRGARHLGEYWVCLTYILQWCKIWISLGGECCHA